MECVCVGGGGGVCIRGGGAYIGEGGGEESENDKKDLLQFYVIFSMIQFQEYISYIGDINSLMVPIFYLRFESI